ncbi:MAG: cell wall metabolism sensor histidine kinase WalK [Chloroflexota bacterium]|nr:cell wall metabolism sensor histidine kinase WalK [Chloroflexota bacterium]
MGPRASLADRIGGGPITDTITSRIVVAAGAGLLIAVLVLGVSAPLIAQDHDTLALDAWLTSEAQVVGDLARDGLREQDASVLDPLAHRFASSAGVRVTIIGGDGTVLGESDEDRRTMENHATRPEVAPALSGTPGTAVRRSATLGRDLLYVAVPVRDGDAVIGVARAALPVTTLQSLAARLGGLMVGIGLIATVIALTSLVVLAGAITRPIGVLTARAEALAAGTPVDFEMHGPAEVERLGRALRRMATSIMGERRAAEAERDRLAVLIDELSDAIVIADHSGRIVLANRAAQRIIAPDAKAEGTLVEVIRDHEVLDAIGRARLGEDEIAEVERAEPLRFTRAIARKLAGGQLLLVIQDLTKLRRLETVRRDFVANVSHELRTPIASLGAMTELLEGGAIDDATEARDFVRRMHQEIDGLAQLVEELLLLGGIESGQLPLQLQSVAPAELLARARERFSSLAERSGVHLSVDALGSLARVRADPERVGQVFANLIHNAVKYSPPGSEIRLGASQKAAAVAFTVRDTGTGIDPGDLDRIFERFYKAGRGRGRGGTGLGLAIAKHIVQAHAGELDGASEGLGRGATFTFTLPAAQ